MRRQAYAETDVIDLLRWRAFWVKWKRQRCRPSCKHFGMDTRRCEALAMQLLGVNVSLANTVDSGLDTHLSYKFAFPSG